MERRDEIMLVKDLLENKSRPGGNQMISVDPDLSLDRILTVMAEHNVRHVIVLDKEQQLQGVISERDMRLAAQSPLLYSDNHDLFDDMMDSLRKFKARDIMARRVTTIEEDDLIVSAAKLMRVARITCLPVLRTSRATEGRGSEASGASQSTTGRSSTVVGVLTHTDLLDHLIRVLEPLDGTVGGAGDEQ